MATLAQDGINCRNRFKRGDVSKTPCARSDRIPAVIRRALMGKNEVMLFMRIAQKTRFLRYITARPRILRCVTLQP